MSEYEPVKIKAEGGNQRKRKMGMKYDLHTDSQRINLMYDLFHHQSSHVELTIAYDINYNTIRNMQSLYIQELGVMFKH